MVSSPIYLCRRNNKLIILTEELAHSGEAKVWRTDFKGYLAKIYHDRHNERIAKLQLMVIQAPSDPNSHLNHISFAWPYSILEDEAGEAAGFLMPEVVGSQTLLKLCTPQLRRRLKLQVDWYFLHVVARNVAGIIQAIHAKGYVLGDIKLENILVNNRALPTIIDTDSFQVPDPYSDKIYRCLVGSEGFTPAELIGVDIASVNQTEVHDRFRLGVVIYYLLFGGPPFRGLWQGSGDPPEQSELIRRGLWPFSSDSLILPSQTTMPLEILHPQLQACFSHCFNDGHQFPHKRPTAGDWVKVLELSLNDIVSCGKVDSHHYSASYGHCYWCDRARDLKFDLFPGNALVAPQTASNVTDPSASKTKISLPKVSPPPKQLPQKWSRRKVLAGLGLATVGGAAGIKIFAQPLSVTQKILPPAKPAVYLKPTPFTEELPNGIQLEMVGLPAGKFLIGSHKSDPDAWDSEFPQQEVAVLSFAIGKYPVTQAQWQAVMDTNPSHFDNDPQNPVEEVSWDDCKEFCRRLYELTGKTYRLPSEAEWEYACRGRTTTRYSFGDNAEVLEKYAWLTSINDLSYSPVGKKKPNPWGIHDMHGNMLEWCEDGWHENYEGAPTDGSPWNDNHNETRGRVCRGSSGGRSPKQFRSANRIHMQRGSTQYGTGFGFRLVLA
ncbi:SUMF1/EgtB/PvdO family nonheme iron enzyme [Synechocystis sp. PCC 7338]|uniref:SUMF1/EgtB/PvdO family nonheme iron enzyme n=1 Tax=Synechocystis sp. PCC 7338 TaxID=2732530 RepID=UPI001BB08C60|nr:SUMF1/EgtB/PvdO family nonheme iron enzyme [Synechocystis sp. PCC 7338]QUS60053.1 SUMF1/EgtB/PvdO family nonheme iron enzyme [Synechocystis sp. PCC 7338]